MLNKKYFAIIGLLVLTPLLTGCTKKKELSFEDIAKAKIIQAESDIKLLKSELHDTRTHIKLLIESTGVPTKPKYNPEDVLFDSILLVSEKAKKIDEGVAVPVNSEISFKVDVLNSTSEEITGMVCSAYITYYNGNTFLDKHFVDSRFEIPAKTVRKDIEFKGFPIKESSIKHVLTVELKDNFGNLIHKFEKEILAR